MTEDKSAGYSTPECSPKTGKISSLIFTMGCCGGPGGPSDEDEKVKKEANKRIEKQLQKDKQLYRATHRLLLLGGYLVLEAEYRFLPSVITT